MKKLIGLLLILLVTAGCEPARNAVLPFKGTILVLHPAGEEEPSDDRLQETVQVLERRLDGLGVASAHVQPWGVGQILVWLPGVRLS